MASESLTKGAIPRMLEQDMASNGGEQPVCQILTVRKIPSQNPGAADRYRVILSDGEMYVQAMLSSQTTYLVEDGSLERNCIVRITNWAPNRVANRRIIIILSLDVVAGPTAERIGDPQNIEKANDAGTAGEGDANKPVPVKYEAPAPDVDVQSAGATAARSAPRTTTSVDMSNMPIYPIEALSPYQNKWTIKARVTSKSEIKHWSNARGEGKLFSCNFLDESGEIKATGFNEQVDRLFPLLKEGHVYYVSKARINIARKKFSNLSNEYEITFERDTQINECPDASDVPDIKFNFVALDSLDGVEPKQTCDVIGVVENVGDVSEIISKASQKPITKRELTLVDPTGMSVRLTLWGKTAETYGTPAGQPGCSPDEKPVIAFKGVSVGDFGGRSLSMFSSSTMHVNPDIPEAHGVRGWYDAEGFNKSGQFKTYNAAGLGGTGGGMADGGMNARERKLIQQAKDENLGMSEKPDYFNFKGTVIFVKNENLYYPACPKEGCNKKITQESENSWRCEKCEMTYEAPEYRYIVLANVQDHTGSIWISGFNEIGLQMIGVPAGELAKYKEAGDDAAFRDTLERANARTWLFNIRAKQDVFNDTPRVRYTVTKMSPIDFVKEGNELVDAIKRLL